MIRKYYLYIIFQILSICATAQTKVDRIPYGTSNVDPGYSYALNSRDIIGGLQYSFLQNDSLTLNFSPNAVQNNEIGSRQIGSIMDMVLKSTNRDNIDWTMFLFSNTPIVEFSDNSKTMFVDSVKLMTTDTSYNIYGYAKFSNQLKISIKIKLLPNSPIVKIKVKLKNKSNSTIVGNWGYVVDPEEPTQENSYIPGRGTNYGVVSSGWTSNYVYSGILGNGKSTFQNHAIAWIKNVPNKLYGFSYSFGINYDINLKSQDSTLIEFYQLTAVANKTYPNGAVSCITNWTDKLYDYDPELAINYQIVAGKVEGADNTNVRDAYVRLYKDINTLVAEVKTNEIGEYKLIVPKLTLNTIYVVTAEKIGYLKQSRKFQLKSKKPLNIDFLIKDKLALKVALVDASFTKNIKSEGLLTSTNGDLILENNFFVMAISAKQNMPNSLSKKGTILDFYNKTQELDLVDWIKISKISSSFDTLDSWWQNDNVWIDTIYISEKYLNKVVVKTEGKLTRSLTSGPLKNYERIIELADTSLIINSQVKIVNEYTLEASQNYVTIKTSIINSSSDTNIIYFGDIIKLGGGNEKSYIPGVGEISNDFGQSQDFLKTPVQPWFANYSKYSVSYGVIFDEKPDYVYAVRRWGSSVSKYTIKPTSTVIVTRHITIAANNTNNLFRQNAIYNIYKSLAKSKSNFVTNVLFSKKQLVKNDTLTVTVKYYNFTPVDINLYSSIEHPQIFRSISIQQNNIFIPKYDSLSIKLYYVAVAGGKSNFIFNYHEQNKYLFQESYQVFVNAPGWFRGDNHTHSTFSDGGSTLENNVIFARDFGLSFLTATEHNTTAHFGEINRLAGIYKDMVLMAGEEITTTKGHCLAYNINTLVPWNLSIYTEQNIIDSVNRQHNAFGKAFAYIAHPNDPIYNWKNLNLNNLKGLEIWNSYNLEFNFKDPESKKTFAQWDSLNLIGHKLFGLSNSDAHSAINVGANYIVAKLDTFSKNEVLRVMRDKGCFYGSNGPEIEFNINNAEMGSTISLNEEFKAVPLKIVAKSGNNNVITELRLIKNGFLLEKWNPNKSQFNLKKIITISPNDFFRIEVECGNGFAFSNPIWITQNPSINNFYKVENKLNNDFNSNLTIIPNPAKDFIKIDGLLPKATYHYILKNLQGREITSGIISNSDNLIHLQELESDFLILSIFPELAESKTVRLLLVIKKD